MKTSATDMMKCYFITLWNTTLSKLTCRLATVHVGLLSSVLSMILTLSINKSLCVKPIVSIYIVNILSCVICRPVFD